MLLAEIGKYIGFCVYRRSYLIWSPVVRDFENRWEPGAGLSQVGEDMQAPVSSFRRTDRKCRVIWACCGHRNVPNVSDQTGILLSTVTPDHIE